jgi:hypothetical protein
MNKSIKHVASLTLGVLLAVAILCSNIFPGHAHPKKEGVKTEQSPKSEVVVFSAPTLSPPSVFHVTLSLDIFCLFDVTNDTTYETAEVSDSIDAPKLFLTLFRVIISPNAP